MLYNDLKIAIRNLVRHKVFSFINIFGLALGMTCSILLLLWVKDELSFDRFHKNGSQLYRVMANVYWGEVQTFERTPGPLAEAISKEIPEVTQVANMTDFDFGGLFKTARKRDKEVKGRFASANFFEMFTFPLVHGTSKTALSSPNGIVISESLARKYFSQKNPVGETITIDNWPTFQITGVMQDVPANASTKFDFVIPLEFYKQRDESLKSWGNYNLRTFIKLHPTANPKQVEAKLQRLLSQYNPGSKDKLFLQSYGDGYLYAKFTNGKQDGGRIDYVRLFLGVAVFILIIACINFMNLSTARSANRAKEVGVRKVIGATRAFLIRQFLGEAVLMALLAMVLSMVFVKYLMPIFNQLTGKQIAFDFSQPYLLVLFLATTLLTGLLAGSYPAFFLSSLKPVSILKGALRFKPQNIVLRQGLVVFQFMLAVTLMVGALVVHRQVDYIKNKHLGFERENLLLLYLAGDLSKHALTFQNELLQSAGVKAVSFTDGNPMQVDGTSGDINWPGRPAEGASISAMKVGYDFIRTMSIQLKAGRDFSPAFARDSTNYIINEAAARMMNMPDPIGQEIEFWNGKGKIIGVVKDFHLQSLHVSINPLILVLQKQNPMHALIRLEAGKTTEALANIQGAAHKLNPNYPVEYQFLDETFERQYKSETIIGQLTNYFAAVAILISCLGLFGLALFTAEQRTKEIGIRKVLGASVSAIVAMLSRDFLKLVLLANVIAWPVGWFLMHQWLQNFTYRTNISWEVFATVGLVVLLIALLTVSFQAVKAALANPVKALRSE